MRHRGKVLQTAQWNHCDDNLFQTCCGDCASGVFRVTIIKPNSSCSCLVKIKPNTACFFLPGVHVQLHELCNPPPLGHVLVVKSSPRPHPFPHLGYLGLDIDRRITVMFFCIYSNGNLTCVYYFQTACS